MNRPCRQPLPWHVAHPRVLAALLRRLAGQREIPGRETDFNGSVACVGTFGFVDAAVIDLIMDAQYPAGKAAGSN